MCLQNSIFLLLLMILLVLFCLLHTRTKVYTRFGLRECIRGALKVFSWYVALEEDASMMASVLGRGLHVVVGICDIFSWGSLKLN